MALHPNRELQPHPPETQADGQDGLVILHPVRAYHHPREKQDCGYPLISTIGLNRHDARVI